MRILVASAASRFRDQLTELLRGQGYEADHLEAAAEAGPAVRRARPHLLVLIEPFFNGDLGSFLGSLRGDGAVRDVPVLCVAPRSGMDRAVESLDAGCDDFMHKPFNAQIFLARVRTLLRRRGVPEAAEEETVIQRGVLTIKLLTRQVLRGAEPLVLTRLEFELLAFLARQPERVYKREELLAAVWNYPDDVETRTLDKHVESLRRKLGPAGRQIETVHGVGYRFASPARAR